MHSSPSRLSLPPTPSALLTMPSAREERRIRPVGWVGVVCGTPPLVSVTFGPEEGTSLPVAGDLFGVNFPDEEILRVLAGGEPSLPSGRASALISLSLPGDGGGEMLLTGCPVVLECRCRSLLTRFGQHRLCGEILAVYLDGERQARLALDLRRLSVLRRKRARTPLVRPLDSRLTAAG